MNPTEIHIPAEVLSLLEATAIANGYKPEEVVLAAIEAFLQSESDQQASTD
jgi:hypothetical protein